MLFIKDTKEYLEMINKTRTVKESSNDAPSGRNRPVDGGRRKKGKVIIAAVALTLLFAAFASIIISESSEDEDMVLAGPAGRTFNVPDINGNMLRYTVTVDDAEVELIGSMGSVDNVVIPEFVSDPDEPGSNYTVTAIGKYAFSSANNMTNVTIPSSVVTIKDYAFYWLSNLTVVNMDSVKIIGDWAFSNVRMTTIDLSSVETIGSYAFYYCINLSTADLSSAVAIKDYAFYYCTNLTTIDLSSVETIGEASFHSVGLTHISANNGPNVAEDGVLFNSDKTTLIMYPSAKTDTSYTVPSSVTTIGNGAFSNCRNLTTVDLSSVEIIGDHAFYYCTDLTTVDLSSAVTIGDWAFYYCYGLTTVDLSSAVTIGDNAFYYCYNLTTMDLSSAVTIGYNAFYHCTDLTTVDLSSAMVIKGYAFYYCTNLTTMDLSSVVLIGMDAFNATNITYVTANNGPNVVEDGVLFNSDKTILLLYPYTRTDTSYTVPSSVMTIGNGAFSGASGLETVEGMGSVTKVGDHAFYNCHSLVTVDLSSAVTIGSHAFSNCYNLSTIDLSFAVSIGDHAFSDCYHMDVIDLSSVLIIGSNAFSNCHSLTAADLSSAVLIGSHAFFQCVMLKTIDIGSNVLMGDYAFGYCGELTAVNTGSNVLIGTHAFYGCGNIEAVNIGPNSIIGTHAFYNSHNLITLDIGSDVMIRSWAFSYSYNLRTVNIGSNVTIGEYAFHYCHEMQILNIGSNVIIEDMAFQHCNSLRTLNIGPNATIGDYVFQDCYALTTIDLSSVTYIGNYAFYNCHDLTAVDLSSAKVIGFSAFQHCNRLEKAILSNSLRIIGNNAFMDTNITVLAVPVGAIAGMSIVGREAIIVYYEGATSVTATSIGDMAVLEILTNANDTLRGAFAGTTRGADDVELSGSDNIYSFWALDVLHLRACYLTVDMDTMFTISYDLNGGAGAISDKMAYDGDQVSVALSGGLTAPAGMSFKEWNTMPDGSGTSYAAGEMLIMPAEDMTLYAIWYAAAECTHGISLTHVLLWSFVILIVIFFAAYVLKRIGENGGQN